MPFGIEAGDGLDYSSCHTSTDRSRLILPLFAFIWDEVRPSLPIILRGDHQSAGFSCTTETTRAD